MQGTVNPQNFNWFGNFKPHLFCHKSNRKKLRCKVEPLTFFDYIKNIDNGHFF